MRKIIFAMMVCVLLMIVGCQEPTTEPEPTPTKEPTVEPTATTEPTAQPTATQPSTDTPGVHRTLSKTTLAPGEEFTYTLKIVPSETITYWLFNDGFPAEVEYVSNDGGSFNERSKEFKEVELSDMSVMEFTVTAKAPATPGSYMFSGQYFFEGDKDGEKITGDEVIEVR